MMEPPSLKSPAKPPLITPSASPPPIHAYRRPLDVAPLFKRQRVSSTPRRTDSERSASLSSRPLTPVDVQQERAASRTRLLDVWNGLAERYSRPLDEDDIVDVMTGKITKDNGVLRNSRKIDFGEFSIPNPGDLPGDEDEGSDALEDEADVYELDELDAFAEPSSHCPADRNTLEVAARAIPLIHSHCPADADDLREFLEAERRRKEVCGSDVDEAEDDTGVYLWEARLDDEEAEDGNDSGAEDSSALLEPNDVSEGEEGVEEMGGELGFESASVIYVDSEDELDNWGADETNIVRLVLKQEALDSESDSDIEIIEPALPSSSNNKAMQKSSKDLLLSSGASTLPMQLQTPPQSHSSSTPPIALPQSHYPSGSSRPIPSSSCILTRNTRPTSASPQKPAQWEDITPFASVSSSSKLQLDKPPLRLDLSKLPKKQKSPKKQYPTSTPSPTKPRLKPVVLMTPRKFSSTPFTPLQKEKSSAPEPSRKGKERETTSSSEDAQGNAGNSEDNPLDPPSNDESDDPITISPPAHSHKAHRIGPPSSSKASHSRRSKEIHTQEPKGDADSPSNSNGPAPRPSNKRKRRASDQDSENMHGTPVVTRVDGGLVGPSKSRSSKASPQPPDFVHTDSRSRIHVETPTSDRRRASRTIESDSHSEASQDSEYETPSPAPLRNRRSRSRSRCAPALDSRGYPFPQMPYPGLQHHPPQMYAPIPNPRAQFIITQAMQQLSALVGAPWAPPHMHEGPMPYTPSRHHHTQLPNLYSTPTHHHHPYPYTYDPNLSHATLPPDSPEPTPEKPNGGRRKSIVSRSRSRGRRVSFKFEGDIQQAEGSGVFSSPPSMRTSGKERNGRLKAKALHEPHKSSGKGKAKATEGGSSGEESEGGQDRRGRSFVRGQTPGPQLLGPSRNSGPDA